MVDRAARDRLIYLLERIARGEATLEVLSYPMDTSDQTVEEITEHFVESGFRLPLSNDDDLSRPSPGMLAEMERAIVFLRGDAEFKPTRMGWLDRFFLLCLAVFLIGFVTEAIANDRIIPAVANPIRLATAIAGGIVILYLGAAYVVWLAIAAVHIFRVRVLGHRISDVNANDWPFET